MELEKRDYTTENYSELVAKANSIGGAIKDIGDRYVIETNNKSIEDIKILKNEEVNQIRDEKKNSQSVKYNEDLFDIDDVSKMNITGLIIASSMMSDEFRQIYRSKTNNNHFFSKHQLMELGVAIANKVEKIYQKSWELKEKVERAMTIEDVEAVIWED